MLPSQDRQPVPVRTILVTIGLVLATGLILYMAVQLSHIITLLLVAGFFAVVLSPPVSFLETKLHLRRGLAAFLVLLLGLGLLSGLMYSFVRPVVDQTQQFVNDFPSYVEDARAGRGTIGHLVKKYNIDEWVQNNKARLEQARNDAGAKIPSVLSSVASAIVALVTVLVLAILMLLEGPKLQEGFLNLIDAPHAPRRRERVRRVAGDAARAVTGYMAGNLLISLIAGAFTYVWLLIAGVPFKEVLALWVAFADLIPLVGATLGAVPAVFVAFLHSTTAGIGTIIFFVAYQQFENHVLQVTVMSKTVDLNPLAVLVSVLVGVELFGILGALLAIPVAGVIQVIARDIYDERRGRLKPEPTVGTDEVPVLQPSGDNPI
jgi:predicted PurR-regulated permease PerM